ncbi:hypothetical protein LQ772_06890 [Frateuria edaphi]|uniref:gp53-like domain-containing protein n=1 Tax=Frateuria edaphi TaxID=2898793 RepID=UPI001E43E776|nr:hypothetical protein [Frateuria edaphi]UGB47012.1 hypothetical protein LQ772_06890 [Frateuria edaphi]
MATNDFLPFAGGAGANVLTQADYAALAALGPGFGSGILLSDQLNKVLRQGTVMAAALAQFIADNSGNNVVDDGTTATIESSLVAAIAALRTAAFSGSNQSLGANGYQKFPGGLILQWGGAVTAADGSAVITFPIAFPNGPLVYFGTVKGNTSLATTYVDAASGTNWTATAGKFWCNSAISGVGFNWWVIGK